MEQSANFAIHLGPNVRPSQAPTLEATQALGDLVGLLGNNVDLLTMAGFIPECAMGEEWQWGGEECYWAVEATYPEGEGYIYFIYPTGMVVIASICEQPGYWMLIQD